MSLDEILIFWKDTNTGLYLNFNSFVPLSTHILWIRNLISSASHISFDLESLFTNVTIQRTVNMTLNAIDNGQLICKNLRKWTLKKR